MKAPGSPSSALHTTYFGRGDLLGNRRPLQAGRIASAAAPTQTAARDLIDDLLRGHLRDCLGQGAVTLPGDVVVDALGIDLTAVLEHDLDVAVRRTARVRASSRRLAATFNRSTRTSTFSGSTARNSSPVSGISTSGPAAHRPRQPTRLTATSVTPSPTSCSVTCSNTRSEPADRQPAAWHTHAVTRARPTTVGPVIRRLCVGA